MHWLVKERFNKLDSNYYRDLSPLEIDELLNSGQLLFLESHAYPETTLQDFDMVNSLLVTAPEQPVLSSVTSSNNVYQFNLKSLKYPLFKIKRITANTNCGEAKVELVGHDRLSSVLEDYHQGPSKKWKRLVGVLAKSSTASQQNLYIYSEAGFTVSSIQVDYIRQPKEMFLGGYDTIEYLDCKERQEAGEPVETCTQYYNTTSQPQDCEIDERYHSLIIDYAVREASRILKDVNSFQLQQAKIQELQNN